MKRIMTRRAFLTASSSLAGLASVGCGTILYPERIGQPAGRLDWRIVGLDAIGLLLFFVPGVIAFAVDFCTGAIFLPPGQYARAEVDREGELRAVEVAANDITPENVERIVSAHAGRPIRLVRGNFQTRRLENIDEFWPAAREMQTNHVRQS